MKRLLVLLALLLPLTAAAQSPCTVKEEMDRIGEAFGVYFVYDASLPVDVPTTFRIDPAGTLQKNLRKLFNDTGISWYVKTKYVVLNECCATLRQTPVWPEPNPELYLEPVTVMDTLAEAVKTACTSLQMIPGGYQFSPALAQRVVTPLGEGDVLKYAQSLPSVSAGGEGVTALHVRGGDMGANAVTLDGVPVYGISHLMGLAFVLPGDVTGISEITAGGFRSDVGNFTSSHIRLQSYTGDFERARARFTVNPFLSSASVSMPLKKGKSSFLGSVRISPVGLEYKAFKNVVDQHQDIFDNMGATVGDLYGKITVRCDNRNDIAFSLFGSLDDYRFDMPEAVGGIDATEKMGWSNVIANLSWDTRPTAGFDCIHTSLSLNDHQWNQEQSSPIYNKKYSYNRFQILHTLDELMLQSTGSKSWDRWSLRAGIQLRGTRFNPGSYRRYTVRMNANGHGMLYQDEEDRVDKLTWSLLSSLYGELEYAVPDRLLLRFSLRGNIYKTKQNPYSDSRYIDQYHHLYRYDTRESGSYSCFHPDADVLAQIYLTHRIGIEGTFDYRTQYNHPLEMMQTGWTFDPIIPAEADLPPERALQSYLGLFGGFGMHSFRVGGFYKQMWNLVYRNKATGIYSRDESHWRNGLVVGDGNAYGAEFLYVKEGRDLSWQLSYTWSKSDRRFPEIAQGASFPARYDRRHMLHASARWKGLTASFTLQSGHNETISVYQYFGYSYLHYQKIVITDPLVVEPNNLRVPFYLHLDLGYRFSFSSGRDRAHPLNHNLTLGVYNLFNRRNTSQMTFDIQESQWKRISYFPIMPSITYQLEL